MRRRQRHPCFLYTSFTLCSTINFEYKAITQPQLKKSCNRNPTNEHHEAFTVEALLLLRDAGEAAMVPSRTFTAKGKYLFLSALKQSRFQNKLVKIYRKVCPQGQLMIHCACKLSSSQVEILHKEKTRVKISRQRNKHILMFYIHFLLSPLPVFPSNTQYQCKVALHRDTVMQSLNVQHQLSPAV